MIAAPRFAATETGPILRPMLLGLGTDLTEVRRIAAACARHGDRFLARVFTADERRAADARRNPAEYLAGRFAAKEAVLKALGTGWGGGLGFRDIGVHGSHGPPSVVLDGPARARLEALGGRRVLVSITHAAGLAVATAVLTG